MKLMLIAICFLTTLSLSTRGLAQDAATTLHVGDAAPALAGGKWLKGDPIEKFEAGKIYVVEFWATWCGPCREAIPHVSEMQAAYGKDGVTFIGQNVWEHDQSKIEPFLAEMGDKMSYHVRADDLGAGSDANQGKMAVTWMQAAGQHGIPCSFLIGKDGKIAWIGHPMELEPVLKQVIAGKFDPKKEAADASALNDAGKALYKAMQEKNFDAALAKLDEVEKLRPDMADNLLFTRFQVQLQKKDYDTAYKTAADAGERLKDNPQALNAMAWTIVDMPGVEKRDLPLAEKLATRAVEKTKRGDGAMLDTLARIYFEKGELTKAVDTQTAAVGAIPAEQKSELQTTLDKYKKALSDKSS